MGKRFAEAAGGLYALDRGIATMDHKRMMDMYADRLCQDHRAQQIAAGFRNPEDGIDCPGTTGDEDMPGRGDTLSVTGDQYHYHVPTTVSGGKSSKWLAAAAILGPLAAAAITWGTMLLMDKGPGQTPQPQPENTDTITEVVVE